MSHQQIDETPCIMPEVEIAGDTLNLVIDIKPQCITGQKRETGKKSVKSSKTVTLDVIKEKNLNEFDGKLTTEKQLQTLSGDGVELFSPYATGCLKRELSDAKNSIKSSLTINTTTQSSIKKPPRSVRNNQSPKSIIFSKKPSITRNSIYNFSSAVQG